MIFHFPDLDTLRIAITSGLVPMEMAIAPAHVAFDASGRPSVQSEVPPSKTTQTVLKRLGVKIGKAHHAEPIAVSCWPQIVPVVKETGQTAVADTVPVLFDIPAAKLT